MFLFLGLKILTLIGSLLSTAGFIGFFAFTATLGPYKWQLLVGGLLLVALAEGASYLIARQSTVSVATEENVDATDEIAARYKHSDTPMGQFAAKLNGRPYGEELNSEEEEYARQKGWAVVYGEGDDHCIISGAATHQFSAWSVVSLYCVEDGLTDSPDVPGAHGPVIRMQAAGDIQTSIPRAEKFVVMGEYGPYGEGLVFALEDCKNAPAL